MSVWFISAEGDDLWNPSNRAADFYIRGMRLAEAFLQLDSGIGDVRNDEVIVESERLAQFFDAAQQQFRHPTMRAQAMGLLSITTVLLVRSKHEPQVLEQWNDLASEAERLGPQMPH